MALPALQERVRGLAGALRHAGVPVAMSDGLDAQRAIGAVDLLDRAVLREALAATLTSSPGHRIAFDPLFDLYFPRTAGPQPGEPHAVERPIEDFLADLVAAVLAGDEAALRSLAHEAVAAYGSVEDPGAGRQGASTAGRSFFAYRVFRHFNLAGLLRRATTEAGLDDRDDLVARLARDEFEARLRRFREAIDAEIRRRQAEERSPEEVARRTVRPLPADVDFFSVTAAEQEHLRAAVRPLARKLATRLAIKRKRARDGRLDARRTLRRALGTGGTPIDPAFRARKLHRPELVLLCDTSGSVAAFAKFTLMLCHALQGGFSRVRSFAFIDTVDEVTELFERGDFSDAMRRLAAEADVVWLDGHSDYGHAFEVFTARHLAAVTPRSTVLVLGDARNNYRAANGWALKEIADRARRLYWLNPEPVAQWDSGDSIAADYARHCDRMVECRTLNQLAAFVEAIA